MKYYSLSLQSQKDIDAIYNYGVTKFGKKQALNYLIELQSYFKLLLNNPYIGRQRDEIKLVFIVYVFLTYYIL